MKKIVLTLLDSDDPASIKLGVVLSGIDNSQELLTVLKHSGRSYGIYYWEDRFDSQVWARPYKYYGHYPGVTAKAIWL